MNRAEMNEIFFIFVVGTVFLTQIGAPIWVKEEGVQSIKGHKH